MSLQLDPKAPFRNLINNELTSTEHTRHGVNPSTEEALPEVPVSGEEEVSRAVASAKAAFVSWRSLSWDDRASYLTKLADSIEHNHDAIRDLNVAETGKTIQTANNEMGLTLSHLRVTATLRIPDEVIEDTPEKTVVVRYKPLGVGAAIIPWNWPLLLGVGKLGPSVLAGNTVILKPSPFAPYTLLRIGELAAEIFPPGVVQVLSGDESLGPLITHHPDVAKVSFTGSIATGRKVGEICGRMLKRFTLELGGNDAAIVCQDADLSKVVPAISTLALLGSGQICMNIKRIYVHQDIYDAFLAAMVEFITNMPYGAAGNPSTAIGPLQNSTQFAKVKDLLTATEEQKSVIALGGSKALEKQDGKGFIFPPTIVDNPPEDSRIVTEEPFGPIFPILRWTDEGDVIKRANALDAGLGASVWSADIARATKLADQLESGSVWVNAHFNVAPNVPFGGHKASGIGMDWGVLGLKGWCNPQSFWIIKA